jgi:hypothetical protein
VSSSAAIDAAFCSAERVTFAGSMTPGLHEVLDDAGRAFRPTRSSPSRSRPHGRDRTFEAGVEAIHFNGSSSALATMRAPVASSPSSGGDLETAFRCG